MDGAISVIVPTLNAGRQIDTLLTRLEQQTRKPDEIIVVDSSSEDITQEMIKRHPEDETDRHRSQEFQSRWYARCDASREHW